MNCHQNALAIWVLIWLQGKDVASVRQYIESIVVNLVLREPVALMHKHVLPSLLAYHAKSASHHSPCLTMLSCLMVDIVINEQFMHCSSLHAFEYA